MTSPHWRLTGGPGALHPVALNRRLSDVGLLALAALVPAALGLAVTIALPHVSVLLALGVISAVVGVVALMVSSRLEVTVMLLLLYLGLMDGPVKLGIGSHEVTAAVRNVLIVAVCAGALMRIVVGRRQVRLPPLSGWVFAFVGVVLIEVFNPKTEGVLKVVGGFRQELQFVPFFFFAYYLVQSRLRLRQLFLVVGVIGLANGLVSAYQTRLSPPQLASWGPGYHNLVYVPSEKTGSGRIYHSEGEARVRPPALGSDAGFSGGVGVIALPCSLALLATSRRRRWVYALLCLGALLGIITGLGRSQVIGAAISVVAFGGLVALAGRRFSRAMAAMLAILVLGIPAGVIVVESLRSGTFKRYESISLTSNTTLHKENAWTKIPHYLSVAPFGFGLGSVGSVAGLGGRNGELLEGHSLSSETQYNLIVNELGAPGLLVWIALSVYMVVVITRGMRSVRDGDLAILLAGAFAPFFALLAKSTSGSFTDSTISGPYFWFAIGLAAFWFAGPGRKIAGSAAGGNDAKPTDG